MKAISGQKRSPIEIKKKLIDEKGQDWFPFNKLLRK